MPNPFKVLQNFDLRDMGNPITMGQMQKPEPAKKPWEDYQFYQPTYSMQNRFASLLDQQPQPNNPSFARKLFSSLGALGSQDPFHAAQGMAYAPYYNQLAEWKQQLTPMQQAADNERQMNQVGMNANNQMRSFQINQQKADEAERFNRDKTQVAQDKNDIARIRANAYDFKTRHPELEIETSKDGFLIGINPQTGAVTYATDDGGERIKSQKIGADALEELRQKGRMAVVGAQQAGATARNNATIEGANSRTNAVIAGANNRDTNNWQVLQDAQGNSYRYNPATNETQPITGLPTGTLTKPSAPKSTSSSSGLRGLLPAQVNQDIKNKAREVAMRNPSWARYIDPNTGMVARPGGGLFGSGGPDANTYQQIVNAIYGPNGQPMANTPGMPAIPAGSTVEARTSGSSTPNNSGKVMMLAPDGKTRGYVPESQVAAAMAQGYKRQ